MQLVILYPSYETQILKTQMKLETFELSDILENT